MSNAQRSALGKGLSSLIPRSLQSEYDDVVKSGDVRHIDIDNIQPNRKQPRKRFLEDEINDLANSIANFGVLQPIIVLRDSMDKYTIIAGERRWRAAKKAGVKQMPALVKDSQAGEVLAISVIENIQRQNLTPIEEALAYEQLMSVYGHTQDQLSKMLSKSRSHIANFLRLLTLPEAVRDMIDSGQLSAGHAKAIVNAPDPVGAAEHARKHNMNVRQIEAYVKKMHGNEMVDNNIRRVSHLSKLHANNKEDYTLTKDQDIVDIENSLSETMGSRVQIVERDFGGQVIIDFYNLDHLDNIIGQLSMVKKWQQ